MTPTPYYSRGGIELYCADCREVLPSLKADCVVTDPPFDANTHGKADYGFRGYRERIAFAPLDVAATVPLLLGAARRWVVAFCSMEMLGEYRAAASDAWVRSAFWRKSNGAPQFTGDRPGQPGEGIAVMHAPGAKRWNGGGRHGFYDFPMETHDRAHPTQKPLPLMLALLRDMSDAGEQVLDPFAGVGSTLLAAKSLGRRAIGIEIEERYCELAARRLDAYEPLPFDEPRAPAPEPRLFEEMA